MAVLTPPRVTDMADDAETGTRTVRVAMAIAKKLQTIAALQDEMGARFKPVEFLNEILTGPVNDKYAATMREFAEHQSGKGKGKRKT